MKIKNGLGEVKLTPDSERKEEAKKNMKDLKANAPDRMTVAELTKRVEQIERFLGL